MLYYGFDIGKTEWMIDIGESCEGTRIPVQGTMVGVPKVLWIVTDVSGFRRQSV